MTFDSCFNPYKNDYSQVVNGYEEDCQGWERTKVGELSFEHTKYVDFIQLYILIINLIKTLSFHG